MNFVWDEQKNANNKRKHGLSFEVAIHVFNDDNRLEIYDEEHSEFEDRYNTIGLVEEVIFVVDTERRNYIRIISARIATNEERRLYYEQNGYRYFN